MSYSSEVLADSPVLYLRLDEPSGTTATDSSGTSNTGTYANVGGITYGEPSLLAADANQCVKLASASSSYVRVADAASLDLANTFTVEAWIKLAALGGGVRNPIVSKQDNAYYIRISATDKIELVQSQVAILWTANTALATAGPHHIVWTKSGATTVVYLNGASIALTGSDLTLANNAFRLLIGADGLADATPAPFFNGWIDEVAVYPTALSAARVNDHYNAGADRRSLLNKPPLIYLRGNK